MYIHCALIPTTPIELHWAPVTPAEPHWDISSDSHLAPLSPNDPPLILKGPYESQSHPPPLSPLTYNGHPVTHDDPCLVKKTSIWPQFTRYNSKLFPNCPKGPPPDQFCQLPSITHYDPKSHLMSILLSIMNFEGCARYFPFFSPNNSS